MAAAGKREYIAMFSIGAKLLGSFKGAMSQAASRLRKLQITARGVAKGIGMMGAALTGLAIGAGITAAGLLMRKVFSGAEDAYKEQLLINSQLQAVLAANVEIQKLGPEAAQKNMELLGQQAGELQKVGVVSDEVLLSSAKQLSLMGLAPQRIGEMLPVMGDVLAATKGVNASMGDGQKVALQVGKAIKDGQLLGVKRLGLEMGKLTPKEFQALSREERRVRIMDALVKKYQGANVALGQTDIGMITRANHAFGELQEKIGKITIGYKVKWAEFLIQLLPKLEPAIERIGAALGKLFGGVEKQGETFISKGWGKMFVGQTKPVTDFSKAIDGVVGAINKLAGAIEWMAANRDWLGPLAKNLAIVTAVLYGLSVAIGVVSAAIALTPVGWIIIGIMALIAGLVLLIVNWDKVKASVDKAWASLGNIPVIGPLLQASMLPLKLLMAGIQWLIDLDWGAVWGTVSETATSAFAALVDAWDTVKFAFQDGIEAIKGFFVGIGDAISSSFLWAINAVKEAWEGLKNSILNFKMPDIVGGAKAAWGKYAPTWAGGTPTPALAQQYGGIHRSPTFAMLAERGPEAVIPLSGGRRAEGLLGAASRAIGMGAGAGGPTSVSFAPSIVINGNATETEQRAMDSRLRDLCADFIQQFKAAQHQERRLSYDSGYA